MKAPRTSQSSCTADSYQQRPRCHGDLGIKAITGIASQSSRPLRTLWTSLSSFHHWYLRHHNFKAIMDITDNKGSILCSYQTSPSSRSYLFYMDIFSKIVMDTWERKIRVINIIMDMQTSLVTASRT